MSTMSQSLLAFIKKRPVTTFVALTSLITWGGILVLVGPARLARGQDFESLMVFAYPFVLLGPALAAILLTAVLDRKAGLRDLLKQALRWRVAARRYAVALLTAPVCILAVLLGLSLISTDFLPRLAIDSDRAFLLQYSLVAGLMVGVFEELGWTGFAVPRLRRRHGILATGLIVGLLCGVWNGLVVFWETQNQGGGFSHAGRIPLAIYLPAVLLTWQTVYRVPMVWVYDRTASLLLAMLMQVSLVMFWTNLTPTSLAGAPLVIFYLVLTGALCGVVALVAVANGGKLSRPKNARAVSSVDIVEKAPVAS